MIPAEVVLPTSTGAKDSDEIVVFSKNALAWNSDSAINVVKTELNALYGEMTTWGIGDWNISDLYSEEDFGFICRTPTELGEKAIEYFAEALKGRVDTALSQEELQNLNFQLFQSFYGQGNMTMTTDALPFHLTGNEDFTGLDFKEQDLSKITGMTGHQLGQASRIFSTVLPEIVLDGTEDFSNLEICYSADLSKLKNATYAQVAQMYSNTTNGDYVTYPSLAYSSELSTSTLSTLPQSAFRDATIPYSKCIDAWGYPSENGPIMQFNGTENINNVISNGVYDFTRTTGITTTQLLQADSWKECKLPAVTFNGTEPFTVSCWMADLTNVSGLTGTQIAQSDNISEMKCTSAQYNSWKSALSAAHSGQGIYVDNVYTVIP